MKILHIYAKSSLDVLPVVCKAIPKLGKKVGVLTTIQHLHKMHDVVKFLEKSGRKAFGLGQVLGCKIPDTTNVDSLLYIGTGKFHPRGIVLQGREVVMADPLTETVTILKPSDMDNLKKRKKGALMKFYNAEVVGVLCTTKGQNFFNKKSLFHEAMKLQKRFPEKQFYYFASSTLSFNEMENFPFIECWVNCMCPRLDEDLEKFTKGMVNVLDIPQD